MRAYLNVLGAVMIIGLIAALLAVELAAPGGQPADGIHGDRRAGHRRGRDYSFRAEKITDDEIGVVIDAFNKMLDEVQSHARALETSEKLYRAIGESINYGVWVCDAEGRNIYTSDSLLRLVGLTQAAGVEFRLGRRPASGRRRSHAWRPGRNARAPATSGIASTACWVSTASTTPSSRRACRSAMQAGRIQRWAGINLDISRLKNTERALREADRRKDEFLATLAHELRNPLAPDSQRRAHPRFGRRR